MTAEIERTQRFSIDGHDEVGWWVMLKRSGSRRVPAHTCAGMTAEIERTQRLFLDGLDGVGWRVMLKRCGHAEAPSKREHGVIETV
jgi:hypothetical protein